MTETNELPDFKEIVAGAMQELEDQRAIESLVAAVIKSANFDHANKLHRRIEAVLNGTVEADERNTVSDVMLAVAMSAATVGRAVQEDACSSESFGTDDLERLRTHTIGVIHQLALKLRAEASSLQ